MKDIVLSLASILPEAMIVEQLEEGIKKWKADPTPDNFRYLSFLAGMILSKGLTNHTPVEELIKEMDGIKDGINLKKELEKLTSEGEKKRE